MNSRYESHNIAYALSLAKKYGDVWKELDSHNPVAIAKPPNAADAGATLSKVAIPIANSESITKMPTTTACSTVWLRIAQW
jgi:hypothetical protein